MPFGSLWIPVVVSAVAVFVASSILHMVLKYHKADYRALPDEKAVRDALRRGDPAPGAYVTPYCPEPKRMAEPAIRAQYEEGPVAILTIFPRGVPVLGKHLALWLGFSLLVSFVAAYVARHTLSPGDHGLAAMRVTGTVAFAAYGIGRILDSIWKGQPWSNTAREILDGGVYSLVTGLTFLLLWPAS